ncbi:GGDEF domain-containing protein [Devosia sediminis]|uniref:diguanylate cyclase n=1 Tax=Devosia sediminis TaxID=2798801 RepID=A0A934MQL5_9HYPH|nr:GGDEF domain-containing protein [Devosia sediminis]MBJ3784474.1 GGDEF domain-containing protein [Devosia sediminis]
MSAQFYLSLLNPILALSFSILVALLWRRWPNHVYFFPLSVAFLYLGLGFITQEWPLFSSPGAVNYAGNALFYGAVLLACVSAIVRVRAKMPVIPFALVTVAAFTGFFYFALVTPSTMGRIVVLSGGFAITAGITLVQLARAGLRTLADRLFMSAVGLGTLLAVGRPLLILSGGLSLNADGGVTQSSYWGSIAGLTPLLAIFIVAIFVFSLVLDIVTQLRSEADHDLLTGLFNRRGFEAAVADAMDSQDTIPALLVADIDDFKQVNDRFGHAVGDRVIATVGRVLARSGEADCSGRIGGEEFALFYRNATPARLKVISRTIAAELGEQGVEGLPAGYPLTLSIGLHARQGGETLEDMQVLADRALYRAKAAGKNRAEASPARLKLA